MLRDREEEILEALWGEIVEKKNHMCDISVLKDDEAIKQLTDLDYVEVKNNQVRLTNKGREEAKNCVRRHRLAERLFVDVLDIKDKLVHEASCKFEHLLHKGLDENVCILLGHPKTCPHGRPIPEGECCKDAKRIPKKLIMRLSELELDRKATISYLETQDQSILQKIIAIGALPNTGIRLIQKFPSYVFQIGKSQFAIDKELASSIYVRV
nr:metal-dependent transcriptional regulator [Candidatus Omnitrophota bacterium]